MKLIGKFFIYWRIKKLLLLLRKEGIIIRNILITREYDNLNRAINNQKSTTKALRNFLKIEKKLK